MTKFFGTDGIRGRAGEGKLSDEGVTKMARAIGAHFGAGKQAVIGRDTRESGPHIQALIENELLRCGVNVVDLGVIPTPATALLAQSLQADFGIMITASHNPFHDNGVKLFGSDGKKLSSTDQDAIETLILSGSNGEDATPGERFVHEAAMTDYVASLLASLPNADLSHLSVVVDCANGAAFRALPEALRSLGATLTLIGVEPNGQNINAECGSTHTDKLSAAVTEAKADIGVAMDGDADRIILVDRTGQEIDGDQILARLAMNWSASGDLKSGAVVSTVMSNLGLERFLERKGLRLERTLVGDRYVAARMDQLGANLGGEPSGHILMTDYATTGDGSLAALHLLAGLAESGEDSASYFHLYDSYPQVLKNVVFSGESPLNNPKVTHAIEAADQSLGSDGRVLVRASGTEPKIRVMAEGTRLDDVARVVDHLCDVIKANSA